MQFNFLCNLRYKKLFFLIEAFHVFWLDSPSWNVQYTSGNLTFYSLILMTSFVSRELMATYLHEDFLLEHMENFNSKHTKMRHLFDA